MNKGTKLYIAMSHKFIAVIDLDKNTNLFEEVKNKHSEAMQYIRDMTDEEFDNIINSECGIVEKIQK